MSIRKYLQLLKKADNCYVQMIQAGQKPIRAVHSAFNREYQKAYQLFDKMPLPLHPIIADIGANKGQFSDLANIRFSPSKIICCEPLPDAYAALEDKFKPDKRFHLFSCALGAEPGQSQFEINAHDQASSILPIYQSKPLTFSHRDLSPLKKIEVEVSTLDAVCRHADIDCLDLLKLDVQGYELEVLKGAENILNNTQIILTEMSFYSQYQGGVLFPELFEFLSKKGFHLVGLRDFQTDKQGVILQADGLFINQTLDKPSLG